MALCYFDMVSLKTDRVYQFCKKSHSAFIIKTFFMLKIPLVGRTNISYVKFILSTMAIYFKRFSNICARILTVLLKLCELTIGNRKTVS